MRGSVNDEEEEDTDFESADDSGVLASVAAELDRKGEGDVRRSSATTNDTAFTERGHATVGGTGMGSVEEEPNPMHDMWTVCMRPPSCREIGMVYSCRTSSVCCCLAKPGELDGDLCRPRVPNLEELEEDLPNPAPAVKKDKKLTPWETMKYAAGMLLDKRVWLLTPLFFTTGWELAFWNGAFPEILEEKTLGYVLACAGLAEVIGGATLGSISDAIPRGLGRSAIITLGVASFLTGLAILTALRAQSEHHGSVPHPWTPLVEPTSLGPPTGAFIAAALFGLGDCALNNVAYSSVADVFKHQDSQVAGVDKEAASLGAYTVFQFIQNVGSSLGFYLAAPLPMVGSKGSLTLLYITAACLILSVPSFMWVDLLAGRASRHVFLCSSTPKRSTPNNPNHALQHNHNQDTPQSAWAKKAASQTIRDAGRSPIVGHSAFSPHNDRIRAASANLSTPPSRPPHQISAPVFSPDDNDYYGRN